MTTQLPTHPKELADWIARYDKIVDENFGLQADHLKLLKKIEELERLVWSPKAHSAIEAMKFMGWVYDGDGDWIDPDAEPEEDGSEPLSAAGRCPCPSCKEENPHTGTTKLNEEKEEIEFTVEELEEILKKKMLNED